MNGCRTCDGRNNGNGEMHCRILHAICGTQIITGVWVWNPTHEYHDLFPEADFDLFGDRGFMTLIKYMADWTKQNGCELYKVRR